MQQATPSLRCLPCASETTPVQRPGKKARRGDGGGGRRNRLCPRLTTMKGVFLSPPPFSKRSQPGLEGRGARGTHFAEPTRRPGTKSPKRVGPAVGNAVGCREASSESGGTPLGFIQTILRADLAEIRVWSGGIWDFFSPPPRSAPASTWRWQKKPVCGAGEAPCNERSWPRLFPFLRRGRAGR